MHQFEQKVISYICTQQLVAEGEHLLVACSGGIDSMALLYFLHKKRDVLKVKVSCVHVDHMLRGQTSLEDLKFVEAFCKTLKIPFYGTSIAIGEIVENEGGNVQAICRRERYNYFLQTLQMSSATKLVTAHHADDQVESVVMALTTKRAISSLSGIYAKRNLDGFFVIRPFLSVTKKEIREYLQKNNITWREDSSNEKDVYTRNKVRHHIAPILQQINPNVAENIVQLAEQIQADDELLMHYAKLRFDKVVTKTAKNAFSLKIEHLKGEPVSLQRRLVLILLNYIYGDSNTLQTYHLTSLILNLCNSDNGTAEVHLPNSYIAKRSYSILTIQPNIVRLPLNDLDVTINEWLTFGNHMLYVGELPNVVDGDATYTFNKKEVKMPFTIRSVQAGDRIQLAGMKEAKRVSRIFIDEKIPAEQRKDWPLLVNADNEIIAILGIRVSNKLNKVKRPIDDYFICTSSV